MKLNIKHDLLKLPGKMMIASDNSGSIGEKENDQVKISYEKVAYYLFRVAYMESLAANGIPQSILLYNFNGDSAWEKLMAGLEKGFSELDLKSLEISGSTESNFELKESATSLSIVAEQLEKESIDWHSSLKEEYDIAVIGKPLVGEEVLNNEDKLPSLKTFKWLSEQEEVLLIIPVGSKGIKSEYKKINPQLKVSFSKELDLEKSAGPGTSYIVLYKKSFNLNLAQEEKKQVFKGRWK